MKEVVITSAVRTPIGKIGGYFKDISAENLMSLVLNEVVNRAELKKDMVDEIIIGQTKQSSDAPNIARVSGLKAGFPEKIPAYTVHRQCASGMQAVVNSFFEIYCGYADIVLAGGVESMSTAPYYLRNARFGYIAGNGELVDPNTESQPKSQPEEIYGSFNMGITAENLSEIYGISRSEQDEFALNSHIKAVKALETGTFSKEIIPVMINLKGEQRFVYIDEGPRKDTSIEKLSKLKPVFKENGTVTAGNSSMRSDGAAALVLMSMEKAKELKIKPLAKIISFSAAGVDPRIMGIGPVPATLEALKKAGLTLKDIELIELNEAFAAQSIAVIKELNLNAEIVNVNGGAIALGHPLGCSGARIIITLLYEMKRRKVRYGLATICVAGGMGMSIILENIE
ncbi:thiolase family protein [Thermovenabulum gondwanense]|uniref:Acetyl-CoA acetyltransferase n=1 Tax=Thermovenabulum gondwanense TaxID=520767 RepID=A0A162N017_9FIRM|nr:thiolase family protein [Thermovenabulum gondwanense]KYO68618.1 Acetyl-CoA acetyltransferase [Thermovenabulum gondwanense]